MEEGRVTRDEILQLVDTKTQEAVQRATNAMLADNTVTSHPISNFLLSPCSLHP